MSTRVQVLVAATNCDPRQLLQKMNIKTDAVIGIQCDENKTEHFNWNGFDIDCYSFAERGVGLNRNTAMMRAKAEFCIIADDDVRYLDGYAEEIEKAFDQNPKADVILFNITAPKRKLYTIEKKHGISRKNYMRYGAVRIAFRRESVHRNGISFNLSFGGGAKYSHGEDTLFLSDCVNKGLNIIALPITLGELTDSRDSTWFNGFDDRYFYDQGALYAAISRKTHFFLCLQDVIRHKKKYSSHGGIFKNLTMMREGARKFFKNN